jgi:hypothetical protein
MYLIKKIDSLLLDKADFFNMDPKIRLGDQPDIKDSFYKQRLFFFFFQKSWK